jgi:hypothetical protein
MVLHGFGTAERADYFSQVDYFTASERKATIRTRKLRIVVRGRALSDRVCLSCRAAASYLFYV